MRTPWWRNLALIGLVVTLVFNTVGVWQGARSAEEGKKATALGILTSINAASSEAEGEINATDAPARICDRHTIGTLSRADTAKLGKALDHYDYLALLLNQKHVTLEDARTYWQREMVEAYDYAKRFIDPGFLDIQYLELRRYYDAAPKALRLSCS